jgi:hypothetical protein
VLEYWARGMAEIATYKPAEQIMANPGRPNLDALLSQRVFAKKPDTAQVPVADAPCYAPSKPSPGRFP